MVSLSTHYTFFQPFPPTHHNLSDNSVYFLVHEIAHIIKEEYSLECKGLFTNLEMIPILLELISASKENNYEIFNRRQILLMHEAINFLKLLKDMKNICKEEFDIYNLQNKV